MVFFFFQAEDGIRDYKVTGVQTCALPISFAADAHYHHVVDDIIEGGKFKYEDGAIRVPDGPGLGVRLDRDKLARYAELYQIGRASCRERVERAVVGGGGKEREHSGEDGCE